MAPGFQSPRHNPLLVLVAASAALIWSLACEPASQQRDAGDASFDDAARVDATTGGDSGHDAAVAVDATRPDSAAPDTSGSDAGAGDLGSGDAHSCSPASFDLCDGVMGSGASYTLDLTGHSLSGARALSLGSTLAQARGAMAGVNEQVSSFNDFALVYCSEGLLLYFADNLPGSGANKGSLSDDDTLYKITAFGSFSGGTSTSPSLSLGTSAADASSALGTADQTGVVVSMSGDNGEYRYFHQGYSLSFVGNVVASISVFAPQHDAAGMAAAVDFAAGRVGSIAIDHGEALGIAYPTGSTLAEIRAAFGANPEADGDINVDVGGNSVDLLMLSYSVLGLRFTGPSSQPQIGNDPLTGDARKVFTAVVTPPFLGKDDGIGIGSSRADIEARFGLAYASETDAEGRTLYKYNAGSKKLGVVYVDDSACVERAVLYFVNLIDL